MVSCLILLLPLLRPLSFLSFPFFFLTECPRTCGRDATFAVPGTTAKRTREACSEATQGKKSCAEKDHVRKERWIHRWKERRKKERARERRRQGEWNLENIDVFEKYEGDLDSFLFYFPLCHYLLLGLMLSFYLPLHSFSFLSLFFSFLLSLFFPCAAYHPKRSPWSSPSRCLLIAGPGT